MFSIPNSLSIIRIFLIIPVIFFLNREDYLVVFFLIVAAGLSDFFDGYFARKLKKNSNTGKILDPLADKLFIGVIVIFLVIKLNFPVWFTALIIGRDLIIGIFGIFIIREKKMVMQSNIIGKVTFGILITTVAVYIIDLAFLKVPLIYLGVFFIIFSLISYGISLLKFQRSNI
ncbi:CDP-alcohol phosphatidyltransferase family protein [candidate division KSB1 bacterium]